MQQLIDQLITRHNISSEKAAGILDTIKLFIEENYPAFGNSLDYVLDVKYNAYYHQIKTDQAGLEERDAFEQEYYHSGEFNKRSLQNNKQSAKMLAMK